MPEPNSLFGGLERAISSAPAYSPQDKTYSDKVLGKDELTKLEIIMKKEILDAEDLRELPFLLGAVNSKLVNLSDETRYYLGKYITWINEAFSISQLMLLNKGILEKKEITEATRLALIQTHQLKDKSDKEMVNAFQYWSNSSVSLGAMGFDSLTKNKIEQQYFAHGLPGAPDSQRQGITNFVFKGKP